MRTLRALALLPVFFVPLVRAQDVLTESYRAHMAAAEATARLGEPAEARRWLMGAPTQKRGWEWRHMSTLLDQSTVISDDLTAAAWSMSLSPDGRLLAVALSSGPIVLVDPGAGKAVRELAGHAGGTLCVRFSPDGSRLASGGYDRTARIWDPASGASILEFKDHKFPVTSVVFTNDGSRIFSSAYYVDASTPIEGRVHQWDTDTARVISSYRGGVKPLSSLALSPDGSKIAAGSWDSCVFVWDVGGPSEQDPAQLGGKPGPLQNIHINSISFSPDGAMIAAGSDTQWARVYRLADRQVVAELTDSGADFSTVAFAPDGATLALGGDNGAITLWRTSDWSRAATLKGHHQGVRSIAWAPAGDRLYSAGLDRSVRSWDPAFSGYGGVHGRYGLNNYSVAFSPDGAQLACSSSDGTIGLVDSRTGAETLRLTTSHTKEVCTSAVSPDGKSIASCSWDKTFRIHDLATRRETANVELTGGAAFFAWSPDGRFAALALNDKSVAIIDVGAKAVVRTLTGHSKAVSTVAWSADGTRLLTGGADASAMVWDVATGQRVATMPARREREGGHEATIESTVFVPGTSLAATASHDGSVRLWDVASGDLVRVLMVTSDSLYRIAASPDGQRLAVGGKFLYILDPNVEGALMRSKPTDDTIWHLDWSPDSQRLALGSWNGQIVVFDGSQRK